MKSQDQLSYVTLGNLIEVEIAYPDAIERLKFVIVPDEQADFAGGFLGESTMLAKTILGETVGALIPYFTGDASSVRVISIQGTDKLPGEDAAVRRDEIIRRAVEQSDQTNAMIFASSFSGKWGDYDPQGIEKWDTPPSS